MKSQIRFWLLLTVFLSSLVQASTPRDPYEYFFEQFFGVIYRKNLKPLVDDGKKGMFVFF